MDDRIEIALSKQKTTVLLFASLAFVFASIFIIKMAEEQSLFPIFLMYIIGGLGISLFSLFFFWGLKVLFDKKPGLILSKEGLWDNSSAIGAGLILWEDIQRIEVLVVAQSKFLMPILLDPQKYLSNAKSGFQRQLMQTNMNTYGSPIFISATALQISFEELKQLLDDNLKKHLQI